MSAAQNVETARRAYAAFAAADIEGAVADIDDDIEWVVPGNSAVGGTYRGKDEVIGFFITIAQKGFTTQPHDYFAEGDKVVVLTTISVAGETSEQADLLTFRDGKLVGFYSYGDTVMQERVWGTKG
jgi:uncharacterized protein